MLQQGLAFNLASRGPLNGKPLIVYNRTASRVDELRSSLIPSDQAKVSPASSAEAAAKDADIIFTSFADDQSVVDMYDRLLAGCNGKVEGKLFAETSTVLPETAEKLAGKVQEAGGTYVAMPSKFWNWHFESHGRFFLRHAASRMLQEVTPLYYISD